MTNNPTQLPAEVSNQIESDAKAYSQQRHEDLESKKHLRIKTISYYSYVAGATEYATKLHQLQGEVIRLTEWQEKAKELLNPIFEYVDECIYMFAGESKTEAVIKHDKQAVALLIEVFQKHETGLLPDRFIYEKIKTFLYG
jgi:hypothetical protein